MIQVETGSPVFSSHVGYWKTVFKEREVKANLAFRETPHEGASCPLVAAGVSLVPRVGPLLTLTLTAEERQVRKHAGDL